MPSHPVTPAELAHFRTLFIQQKQTLLSANPINDDRYHVAEEELRDETDFTAAATEQAMHLRLRNRQALLIKKIDEALGRIQCGTFGICESCEEPIERRRLFARPMTSLCILCKEAEEQSEKNHVDGNRSKSQGRLLSLGSLRRLRIA